MKTIKSHFLFVSLIVFAPISFSCTSGSTSTSDAVQSETADLQSAHPTIKAYLDLKDYLVETDSKGAKNAANQLVKALKDSEDTEVETIKEQARKIAKAENIEDQRLHFEILSNSIFILAQEEDMGITIYRQYCPMAFQNKGAYWLSAEEEIMNPYFGDKMLHCGVIKDEF